MASVRRSLVRVLKTFVFSDTDSPLFDLPISQVRCLRIVSRHEGERMHDLARRLDVKLPAMSQIVDRLVKQGLLERSADVEDRRAVRVSLTDKSRQIIVEDNAARRSKLDAVAGRIGEDDWSEIAEKLRMFASACEQLGDGEPADAETLSDFMSLTQRRAIKPEEDKGLA